jgi:hypothetical protein
VALAAAEAALAAGGVLWDAVQRQEPSEERENLIALVKQLADGFMLLVRVPHRPGHREVMKLSYDAAHRTGRGRGLSGRSYYAGQRFASSLGLISRVEVFDNLLVGLGASYHAEVVPPTDTYAAETTLELDDPAATARIVDDHRYRPHVYTTGRPRGDRASLTVLIDPHREGLIAPLFVSGLLISGALWFVDREAKRGRLDGQTLAALLLVPFALAAYYVRSAENSYLTRMLRGVRLLAAAPVGAGAFVIASLGLGYLGLDAHKAKVAPSAFDGARYAAYVSAGATAVLALAMVSPLLARLLRPPIRALQRRTRTWSRLPRGALLSVALLVLAVVAVAVLAKVLSGV